MRPNGIYALGGQIYETLHESLKMDTSHPPSLYTLAGSFKTQFLLLSSISRQGSYEGRVPSYKVHALSNVLLTELFT